MDKFIFPMRQSVVAIPYWVAATIRRRNMKMADLLDFKKAQEVLSENDIKSLLCSHRFGEDLFYGIRGHRHDSNPFSQFWFRDQSTTEGRKKAEEINKQLVLEPDFFKDQVSRMFAEASNNQDVYISNSDPTSGYEVVALKDEAVGVILYNGLRERLTYKQDLQYSVLHDVVKLLYAYEHPVQVNTTGIFGLYLETLYRRKAVVA